MATGRTMAMYRNSEVKNRVNERVTSAVNDSGKLAQSIVKNSKSRDILQQTTKNFVGMDNSLGNLDQNLQSIERIITKMHNQSSDTEKRLQKIQDIGMKISNKQKEG